MRPGELGIDVERVREAIMPTPEPEPWGAGGATCSRPPVFTVASTDLSPEVGQ